LPLSVPAQLHDDLTAQQKLPRAGIGARGERLLSVVVALAASLFLLFVVAPLVGLIGGGGAGGVRLLFSDAELRASLALTIGAATLSTLLGIVGATPIAYLLARGRFRGRSVLSAILDLPLLIPHPVAGIALLLVL